MILTVLKHKPSNPRLVYERLEDNGFGIRSIATNGGSHHRCLQLAPDRQELVTILRRGGFDVTCAPNEPVAQVLYLSRS